MSETFLDQLLLNSQLTEPDFEMLRHLYVYQKAGVPDWTGPEVLEKLRDLGLAARMLDGTYSRTEAGVVYVKSLGWTWGHWQAPHLPSPPRPVAE